MVVADRHGMVREALATVLTASGVRVVAECGTAEEARVLVARHRPDLVIVDLDGASTLPFVRALRADSDRTRILVLCAIEDPERAAVVLAAGAEGYVPKRASLAELLDAVRTVAQGQMYVPPQMSDDVLRRVSALGRGTNGIASLSGREVALFQLLSRGVSLTESAAQLGVTVSTASTYRARILQKLRLRTTSDLVRRAAAEGLV